MSEAGELESLAPLETWFEEDEHRRAGVGPEEVQTFKATVQRAIDEMMEKRKG